MVVLNDHPNTGALVSLGCTNHPGKDVGYCVSITSSGRYAEA